jgi:WD40 repeat protein
MLSAASRLLLLAALVVLSALPGRAQEPARTDRLGDPLPAGALARMGTVRLRHGERIGRLAFSADGRTFASWSQSEGGTLCLWETATGKALRRRTLRQGRVYDLRLLPGGRALAVLGGDQGEAVLWDFAAGQEPPALRPAPPGEGNDQERFGLFALSPDGSILAGGSFGFTDRKRFVQLWRAEAGKALGQLKTIRALERNQGVLQWLAFTPDGRTLISASPSRDSAEDVLTFWDVATGKELRRFRAPPAYRHDATAAAAFSTEGRRLALGLQDSTVRLWDAVAGKELHRLEGHERRGGLGRVGDVALSVDGKTLVSGGSDGTVRLWDVQTGKPLHRWAVGTGSVDALALTPDGKTVAAGGQDGMVHLWDVATHKQTGPGDRHEGSVTSLALSPDGATLATTSGGDGVRIWNAGTGSESRHLAADDGLTTVLGFAPDGKLICATHGKALRLWDALTGKDLHVFAGQRPGLTALALSRDGKLLVTHGPDYRLRLWETTTGRERAVFQGNQAAGLTVAFSPDAKVFAAANPRTSAVQLWDLNASSFGRSILAGRGAVLTIAFSPDGKHLATGGTAAGGPLFPGQPRPAGASDDLDGALLLWQVTPGRLARKFPLHPGGPDERLIRCLAFSPDGRTLVTGETDGMVRAYEVATGKLRLERPGHEGGVTALSFSADGRRLASGSQDQTALVWDLTGVAGRKPAALAAADLDRLWADLADADASRAYRAVQALAAAPAHAGPFLKGHLRPAGPPITAARLAQLVEDLDSKRFVVRARADAELEQLGEPAEPVLQKALAGKVSLEKRRRLERLLAKLSRPWERVLPLEQLRLLRAVEALEQMASPAARAILQDVARGSPEAWLTAEAQASLERLKKRPAGAP